ncbi:hypothetical protein ABVT39_027930 [Epinephelus coioides]
MNLMEEIKELKRQNAEKDRKISMLEGRVADLEQYSRMNDLIISGLDIKPRSYARAASREGEVTEADQDSLEQQVIVFLDSKGITLDRNDIKACHPLPRRDKNVKPIIIMRLVNRKQKTALLKQGKKLKGTKVYLNEHLTKKNSDIARQARILQKENRIQSTWTSNCKVFIKLNGSPEEAKVLVIKDITELDKYKK